MHQPRLERNIQDINDAKAARRAEIERRCALMDPPLLPSILNHMESFQASMQITQPMTDRAWRILRPRLLAQLPYAELKEKERLQKDEALAEEYKKRKETKENSDRAWETSQNPVRNRLGALADAIIQTRWGGGRSLTKESSPNFAADVLIHTRQQFYAQLRLEDEAAIAVGKPIATESLDEPPTRTLILENMKWLFDTKIKPLTDHLQREIFLCNGCDGNLKFYGFEGVIQHYAAKHTTALSMGNVVVHWRALWPDYPPFNPDPPPIKATSHITSTPTSALQNSHGADVQGLRNDESRTQAEDLANEVNLQQDSTSPVAKVHSTSADWADEGSRLDASITQSNPSFTTYDFNAGFATSANAYAGTESDCFAHTEGPQGPTAGLYRASHTNGPPASSSVPGHPIISAGHFQVPTSADYQPAQHLPYQHTFRAGSQNMHAPYSFGQVSDLYQRQMDAMAKHAKEVFIGVGGVKDLPGSVRIYVVIQLTVSRFKLTFRNEPSLSMFIDGLDHNATMRPVRSVNGLGCKTCMENGTSAKLFTLPHLVNHFRTVHVENSQITTYPPALGKDWKQDMIDLPDASIISRLSHAAGMTNSKLSLIGSVFPELFRSSLPGSTAGTGIGSLAPPTVEPDYDLADPLARSPRAAYDTTAPSDRPPGDPHIREHKATLQSAPQSSPLEPFEPPGEDEYDPHRPAHLGKFTEVGSNRKDDLGTAWPKVLRHETRFPFHPSSRAASRGSQYVDDFARFGGIHTPQQTIQSSSNWTSDRSQPPSVFEAPAHNAGSRQGGQFFQPAGRNGMDRGYQSIYTDDIGQPMRCSQQYRDASETYVERQDTYLPPPHEDVDAATKFLTNLAPEMDFNRFRELPESDPEAERRLLDSWHGETHVKRRRRYNGNEALYDQRHSDLNIRHTQTNRVSTDHSRSNSQNSRNGNPTEIPRRSGSNADFYGGSTLSNQFFLPAPQSKSAANSSAQLDTQHNGEFAGRGEEMGVTRRPCSGNRNYDKVNLAPWRDASESPQLERASMELYRPSSPVEEDRGNVAYRSSPTSFRQNHNPRAIAYEHEPTHRYEYIDDRDFQDARYLRRVEYVPVEFEDSRYREPAPRYIMSHPVARLPAQYVHYENSYAGQPLYAGAQMPPRDPRVYPEQSSLVSATYGRGYDY